MVYPPQRPAAFWTVIVADRRSSGSSYPSLTNAAASRQKLCSVFFGMGCDLRYVPCAHAWGVSTSGGAGLADSIGLAGGNLSPRALVSKTKVPIENAFWRVMPNELGKIQLGIKVWL